MANLINGTFYNMENWREPNRENRKKWSGNRGEYLEGLYSEKKEEGKSKGFLQI
jgi:hypothetical protein